jgi:hypothetical protein
MSIDYDSAAHAALQPFALAAAALFSVGVPWWLLVALRSVAGEVAGSAAAGSRASGSALQLRKAVTHRRWPVDVLSDGYRPGRLWWEAFDSVRIVLLTGVITVVGVLVLDSTTAQHAAQIEAANATNATNFTYAPDPAPGEPDGVQRVEFWNVAVTSAASFATVVQLLFAIIVQASALRLRRAYVSNLLSPLDPRRAPSPRAQATFTLLAAHLRPCESGATQVVVLLSNSALVFVYIGTLVMHLTTEIQVGAGVLRGHMHVRTRAQRSRARHPRICQLVLAVWRQALNAWTSNPYDSAIGSYLIIFACIALSCGAPAFLYQVGRALRGTACASEVAGPR